MCMCMCVQEQGLHCLAWILALSTWLTLCQCCSNKSCSGACPNCVSNIPILGCVGFYFPDTEIHCSGEQRVHWSTWGEQCLCSPRCPHQSGIFRNRSDLQILTWRAHRRRMHWDKQQAQPRSVLTIRAISAALPGLLQGLLPADWNWDNSSTICWMPANWTTRGYK